MTDNLLIVGGESEAVKSLGSRTTMLHPEIKRHRAWWRKILGNGVLKRLGERVFLGTTAADAVKVCSPFLVAGIAVLLILELLLIQ